MNAEGLGNSRILNAIFKPAGAIMGSRLRQWLSDPAKNLQGADLKPGQVVLEVGCGTGFFTITAAQMVGDEGSVIAMDVSSGFLQQVSKKVQRAGLDNVHVVQKDALDTELESASIDTVLLFGVIPFVLLPLGWLLPEMNRVLKPGGRLAIWLFPPLVHFWVPGVILRSGLFTYEHKKNGILNYRTSRI